MQAQGMGGTGKMGRVSVRAPWKSGRMFDHTLGRLQSELWKSQETGAELRDLVGAMNGIHDTLGGSLSPNLVLPFFTQSRSTTSNPSPIINDNYIHIYDQCF